MEETLCVDINIFTDEKIKNDWDQIDKAAEYFLINICGKKLTG